MAKLGFPHIAVSVPRLIMGVAIAGMIVSGVELTLTIYHARSHSQTTFTKSPTTPYTTAAPQTTTQPAPAPMPQVAPVTPAPTPVVKMPHSATPAPVVTPAPTASVSGLVPVNPTPAPADPAAPTTPASPPTTTGYTSTNWSGYMATTSNYTGVTGSWSVPNATGVARQTSADAAWIGIGGVSTNDLIQVGTDDTVSASGHETAAAFYEILPSAAKEITTLPVAPGDTMTASLAEQSAGQWKVSITDVTNGQSFTTMIAYNSSHSSAEWIEEDPSTVGNRLVPFDTFTPVSFTNVTATTASGTNTAAGSTAQPVTMIDARSNPIAVPSSLGSDGKSFTVTRD